MHQGLKNVDASETNTRLLNCKAKQAEGRILQREIRLCTQIGMALTGDKCKRRGIRNERVEKGRVACGFPAVVCAFVSEKRREEARERVQPLAHVYG